MFEWLFNFGKNKPLKWTEQDTKYIYNLCLKLMLSDIDFNKLSTAHTVSRTWSSCSYTAVQWRLLESEEKEQTEVWVQQDHPIFPTGGNISQLPTLNGWMGTIPIKSDGNGRKHTLNPQRLGTGRRHLRYAGRMVGDDAASGCWQRLQFHQTQSTCWVCACVFLSYLQLRQRLHNQYIKSVCSETVHAHS